MKKKKKKGWGDGLEEVENKKILVCSTHQRLASTYFLFLFLLLLLSSIWRFWSMISNFKFRPFFWTVCSEDGS